MSEKYEEIYKNRKEDIDNIVQISLLVAEVFSGISGDANVKIATQLYLNEQENERHNKKLDQDWDIHNQQFR